MKNEHFSRVHLKPPRPPAKTLVTAGQAEEIKLPRLNIFGKSNPLEAHRHLPGNESENASMGRLVPIFSSVKAPGSRSGKEKSIKQIYGKKKRISLRREIRKQSENMLEFKGLQPEVSNKLNHSRSSSKRKNFLEKHYDRLLNYKISKLEHLLGRKTEKMGPLSEEEVYAHFAEACVPPSKKYKLRILESDQENESDPEYETLREGKIQTSSKIHRKEKQQNDELYKLDRLSMLNVGARYELLNTNKMMVELEMNLAKLNKGRSYKSLIDDPQSLLDTRTHFSKPADYPNPVEIVKKNCRELSDTHS